MNSKNDFSVDSGKAKSRLALLALGRALLAVIVFGIALVPGFLLARVGIHISDEPYNILNCVDSLNTPLAPLSSWIGHLFGEAVGWEWTPFRYFAVASNALSILIGIALLWRLSRNYTFTLLTGAACLLCGTIFNEVHNLYGWDSYSPPLLMIIIAIFISYTRDEKVWQLILMGILSGIVVTMRLPNIAILAGGSIILLFPTASGRISRGCRISIYLLSAIAVIWIVTSLLYGTPHAFISRLSQVSVDQHDILYQFRGYVSPTFLLIQALLMFWASYHLIHYLESGARPWLAFAAAIILIPAIAYYEYRVFSQPFLNVLVYSCALALLGIGAVWFYSGRNLSDIRWRVALALLIVAFIPAVGSNTGFIKFLAWPAIPLICGLLYPRFSKSMKIFSVTAFAALMLYAYFGIGDHTFFDVGTREADYEFKKGVLKGRLTSREYGEYIDRVISDVEKAAGDDSEIMVVRRDNNYLYEYYFGTRNQYLRDRYDFHDYLDDPDYIKYWEKEISAAKKPVTLLLFNAHNPDSALEKMLKSRLRPAAQGDGYIIYVSPSAE